MLDYQKFSRRKFPRRKFHRQKSRHRQLRSIKHCRNLAHLIRIVYYL